MTTWNGKGAIDETHALAAQTIGDTGSTIGNALAASRRRAALGRLPLHRLVGVFVAARGDLRDPADAADPARHRPARDRQELPGRGALVGDARAGLQDLLAAIGRRRPVDRLRRTRSAPQGDLVGADRGEVRLGCDADDDGPRRPRGPGAPPREDAIVVTGAGLPQGMVKQRWVTRRPRTHITSGGFCTMGFTLPAAIGAQLAQPERQVLAICGDGDFLQTMQELPTAVLLGTPVCTIVLDNSGWISIKGGQQAFFGRSAVTDFLRPDGSPYSPDFAAIGRAFGIHAERVDDPTTVRRRGRAGARFAAARRSSTSPSNATSPSRDPTRPAGGTPRAPLRRRTARATGAPGPPRSSSDEPAAAPTRAPDARSPRLAPAARRRPAGGVDRHRADPLEQRRPARPALRHGRLPIMDALARLGFEG